VLNNRVEELLSDAYTKSVVVNASEVIIKPFVLVPRSLKPLSLSSVLSSISSASLASHLSTLRRDILTHYIECSFDQPTSLTISTTKDKSGALMHVLSRFPSSPNTIDTGSPLINVSTILDFLYKQLSPALPLTHKHSFLRSLSKPISTAVLARLLIPGLPSQLEALPAFLKIANQAVDLEDKYIVGMLDASSESEIKAWVNNVCAHYERQRRSHILDSARKLIIQSISSSEPTFHAQLPLSQEIPDKAGFAPADEGDAWGLDDDGQSFNVGSSKSALEEENVWGFDDLEEGRETQQAEPVEVVEEDPGDAWGWNDEEPAPEELVQAEDTWDDPWGEEPALSEVTPTVQTVPVSSQRPSANSVSAAQRASHPIDSTSHHHPKSGPISEPYLVSTLAKSIIHTVEDALHEGQRLSSSGIFPTSPTSKTTPGTLIMQSGALVLDLYRALYPTVAAARLVRPGDVMKFSNNCCWLAEEVDRLVTHERVLVVKDKLEECKSVFQVLADSWYQDGIDRQRITLRDILASAKGFTDTSDQDRYDDCEMAISRVVREIRSTANAWKPVLPKSKYYTAVGAIVEVSLQRILENILAIPDIPEVESHKLSELCRILAALEGLFVEDFNESSFVVSYVSSWLKFSYLSELLEASMADLTYLFEEGALVDFEVDELVKLVRALFADTPLRTKTLEKIMVGHPVR
jgi:centromere/kinetochore protein ZW10